MEVDERWRLASESANRLSRFRRREPVFVALATGLVALTCLAVFLGLVELGIRQLWIAAILSIAVMMFTGWYVAVLGNNRARSAYIAEFRRLNNVEADTDS